MRRLGEPQLMLCSGASFPELCCLAVIIKGAAHLSWQYDTAALRHILHAQSFNSVNKRCYMFPTKA